ncbi:MAG: tyrosine-type recombinase/integrase, partial [Elusimicrobia bacterium]|nr:tyrosine-type recombinase/integrase [Elusimicrobiota bacterium]
RQRARRFRTSDPRIAALYKRRVEIEEEGKAGRAEPSEPPAALLSAFREFLDATLAPETARGYHAVLRPMFDAWRARPVESWDRALAESYLHGKRAGGAWGAATASAWLAACRKFVAWAAARGAAVPNFVSGLKAGPAHRAEPKARTADEFLRLLAAARGSPLEVAVALGGLGGLRRKEMTTATLADVDFAARRLTVHGWKGHRDRSVPIGPVLEEVLRRRCTRDGLLIRRSLDSGYRRLHALCETAGLPPFGWHTLRHTYATVMLERGGAELHEVQAALGHTSLDSTGIYLRPKMERIRSAAERAFAPTSPA